MAKTSTTELPGFLTHLQKLRELGSTASTESDYQHSEEHEKDVKLSDSEVEPQRTSAQDTGLKYTEDRIDGTRSEFEKELVRFTGWVAGR